MNVCLNCGKALTGKHTKFCCTACEHYYDKHQEAESIDVKYGALGPVVREFICANPKCKKHVCVRNPKDKRTRFCCGRCREQFFKEENLPPKAHDVKIRRESWYERSCKLCGQPFGTTYASKEYCSRKCKDRARYLKKKEQMEQSLEIKRVIPII